MPASTVGVTDIQLDLLLGAAGWIVGFLACLLAVKAGLL